MAENSHPLNPIFELIQSFIQISLSLQLKFTEEFAIPRAHIFPYYNR